MKTFMLFCFLILGLAFYQLSGGSDFEPERREVAQVDPVVEQATEPEASELALVQPDETPTAGSSIEERLSRALVSPEVLSVSLETTEPETPAAETAEAVRPAFQSLSDPDVDTADAEIDVAPAVEEQQSADLRQVASSRVNMRNGPGTDFSVLVTLNSGTATEVIETNGEGWVRVRVRDTGQEGWMAEYLLEPVNG